MALSQNIVYNTSKLILKILSPISTNILIKNIHSKDSENDDIDTLDTFTTQLLQKKSNRWEHIRIKRKLTNPEAISSKLNINLCNENSTVDIRLYSTEQLDAIITNSLESNDLKQIYILEKQCTEYKLLPSGIVLENWFSFYAQKGDKDSIIRLQKFIEKINPEQYHMNAKYVHFLAEAVWIRGNISESLKLFEEVFQDYVYHRRKLKLMIKYMIWNVISARSEATLVMIINFTENIAIKYDDYFLLACVWQTCFLSEWYSDQCQAAEILDRHRKLWYHINNRINFVVNSALRSHQCEVVYRLFELLLKYEMKAHYSFVLQSLFNYRYWQNDLRSCTEIIQWAINVDIQLPNIQEEQFLKLLLQQNKTTHVKEIKNTRDFQFKF